MTNQFEDLASELHEFAGEVNEHLTTLQRGSRQYGGWISETAPVIKAHGTQLDEHVSVLAELRDDVNTVLAEMPRQPKFPPVCWLTLTARQADQVWTELGEWVADVLVERYSVNRAQVPDCWALHPGAVEELTWLWTSWRHAWLPTAGANPAAEWHARWRRDALDGVQAAIQRDVDTRRHLKCGPGTHLDAPLPGAEPINRAEPGHLHQPAQHVPAGVQAAGGQPGGWTPGTPPVGPQSGWTAPPPWPATGPAPVVSVPRGPARDMDLGKDPSTDLAERAYWWPHLQAARAQDVARRQEAERRAAAASPPE